MYNIIICDDTRSKSKLFNERFINYIDESFK